MLDSEYKTSLSGALNARMEVPFGPSFKKTIGEYIEVEAGMGLFLEGSVAGFELATTRKQSTWTWNRLNIDIDDLRTVIQRRMDEIIDGSIDLDELTN